MLTEGVSFGHEWLAQVSPMNPPSPQADFSP